MNVAQIGFKIVLSTAKMNAIEYFDVAVINC